MPPQSPDQRQGLGDGVWRLMAALLQAWDVAMDPEKQASPLWFFAVSDITESLLVELISRGRGKIQEAEDVAGSAAAVSPEPPNLRQPRAHELSRAINGAVARLEELAIQEHVAWAKRPGASEGSASASSAAEALMADTVRILARCMELHTPGREDHPSGDLKAKMCAAVLRVVDRCTVAVEFRRSIRALQSGLFEIKLGAHADADATVRVRLDPVWPAPT